MPLSHLCGSSRGFFRIFFLSAKGCGCIAEGRAEGLRFDCGRYGSFAVFALYLRFLTVPCGRRTADNRGFNRISGKRH